MTWSWCRQWSRNFMIETEGKKGVMTWLSQRGLRSLSASSSFVIYLFGWCFCFVLFLLIKASGSCETTLPWLSVSLYLESQHDLFCVLSLKHGRFATLIMGPDLAHCSSALMLVPGEGKTQSPCLVTLLTSPISFSITPGPILISSALCIVFKWMTPPTLGAT